MDIDTVWAVCIANLKSIAYRVSARASLTTPRERAQRMVTVYVSGCWLLSAFCLVLFFYTRQRVTDSTDPAFKRFQFAYLLVYLLAVGSLAFCLPELAFTFTFFRLFTVTCLHYFRLFLINLELLSIQKLELLSNLQRIVELLSIQNFIITIFTEF